MPHADLYTPLPIRCDISGTTLAEAAFTLGPSFTYDLYVNPRYFLEARSILRRLACDVADNPLAPYINLCTNSTLDLYEWYLVANGRSAGSKGAS